MADTTNLGITKPTPGGDSGTWGTTLNTGADNFDTAIAGTLTKSVAGSADVALTSAEALNKNHVYTGALTGNIAVVVPDKSRQYQVFNNTSGSHSLKVKTSAETNGTTVTQGETLVLMCTGTSVISGVTGASQTSVTEFTANNLKVPTCASATNFVAATGSFTTKVSGVAGEFSGTVSAATFDGALTGNVTGDIDGATGSFSACVSATNFVAATGSFTTKVSGVAGEFSGTVSAATFDGALTGNVTGDVDGATGSYSACISATNIVGATGSFTTKVSGVAAEFSGNVSAAEFYGGGGNLTGISASFTGIASDVTPDGDATRDLGSAAAEWDQVYMRYPTLWERRLNIILLGVLNSAGTMKMFASGHCWDPASGNTTLNPDMNDSVVGDFIPSALDASTGFNSKPAGYKASDTSTIILNTDDMGSGNYIGQVIISKQNMASTYVNLSGQFRSHSLNIGGTTAYRPEVQLWYNGGNALNTDTTRYATSKYAYWSVFFYAK